MDKYLLEAYWSAAQSAVEDRNIESLGRIVDCLKGLDAEGVSKPSEGATSTEESKGHWYESKMPYGTTALVKNYIERQQLFRQFLIHSSAMSDVFTPNQFRLWLKENHGEALDDISLAWPQTICTLIKYYSTPENESYKGIYRVRNGWYGLLSQSRLPAS